MLGSHLGKGYKYCHAMHLLSPLTPAGQDTLEVWLARHELELAKHQTKESQHTMVASLAYKGLEFPTLVN